MTHVMPFLYVAFVVVLFIGACVRERSQVKAWKSGKYVMLLFCLYSVQRSHEKSYSRCFLLCHYQNVSPLFRNCSSSHNIQGADTPAGSVLARRASSLSGLWRYSRQCCGRLQRLDQCSREKQAARACRGGIPGNGLATCCAQHNYLQRPDQFLLEGYAAHVGSPY